MNQKLDDFTQAYIECALWSSTACDSPEENEADPNHEGCFDASFQSLGYDELTEECLAQVIADCEDFQTANAELLDKWYGECGETPERAGHDFWLTRNRHGAGYWDRWNSGTPQGKIGQALTDAAHVYGSVDLYYIDGKVGC